MTQPFGPTPGRGYPPPPRRRTGLPVWVIVLLSGVGLLVTLTIIGTVIGLAAGGGTTASPSASPVAATLPAPPPVVPAATLPAAPPTAPAAPPSPTGPTGLFQHPEDVEVVSCGRNSLGWAEATARVTNHSGKASTYSLAVAFENADGSQLLAEGAAFVNRLEPGQTTSETVFTGKEIPRGAAHCRVTSAQRTTA